MLNMRSICGSLVLALVLLELFGQVPLAPRAQVLAQKATGHPLIVFDEGHSNFHTTSGSYSQFAELSRKEGYTIVAHRELLNRKALEQARVLVIVNARGAQGNPAFTRDECDAVEQWVKDGGGLLLIVDHPPYPAAARSLADRLGVDVRDGTTLDPTPGNHAQTPSTLVFTRSNGLLGDHAITRGGQSSQRINAITTFTGSSLAGPPGSTAFLKLSDAAYDRVVESAAQERRMSAKGRAQGVALKFGKGRVVVLGEAAVFRSGILEESGQGGFDNRQLALNVLRWLSQ
ncbi:MAG TPA: DUF4350 domain-containing protein [Pyrinomonadaceae bacterium]|nr:DUF4350 domain-containing protein [Pyrinomonadaceae bacterium]